MLLPDPSALQRAANADPEFRLAARFWDATLQFVAGEESVRVELKAGEVVSCGPGTNGADGAITVTGPPEGWREILAPVPRPFYQDLLGGAVGRHGFSLSGDLLSFAAYYQASQRLIALMRELHANGGGSDGTL